MQRNYSVIIPFHGDKEILEKVLDSIKNTDYPQKEIILVNDGSGHDLSSISKRFQCKLIDIPKRQGPSFARNRGAEAASFENLVFLDSDIIIPGDSFVKINDFLDKKSVPALNCAVSAQAPYANFSSQYANIFFRYSVLKDADNTIFTSFCVLKADSFRKAGGFDEKVPLAYADDLILGWKFRDNGYNFALMEGIEARHYKKMVFLKLIPYWFLHAYYMEKYFIIYKRISGSPKAFYKKEGPLSVIAFFLASLLACSGLYSLPAIIPVFFGILFIINFSFLNFIVKEKGFLFALRSLALITIQQIVYFIGAMMGALSGLKN